MSFLTNEMYEWQKNGNKKAFQMKVNLERPAARLPPGSPSEQVHCGHTGTSSTERMTDRTENFTFPQLCWQAVTMLQIHKHFPSYLSEVHCPHYLRYFRCFVKVSAVSCAYYTSTNSIIIPSHKSGFIFTAVREKIYKARLRCLFFVTIGKEYKLAMAFEFAILRLMWIKPMLISKFHHQKKVFGWNNSKQATFQWIVGVLWQSWSISPLLWRIQNFSGLDGAGVLATTMQCQNIIWGKMNEIVSKEQEAPVGSTNDLSCSNHFQLLEKYRNYNTVSLA